MSEVRHAARRMARVGSIVLLLASTGCFDTKVERPEGPPEVAPAFELQQLGGPPLRLEAMRGKIVILDFWATWCPPCEVQMPVLDELWRDDDSRREHGDDLRIIGISVDTDPPAKVAAWVAERGFGYPIAIGDQDLAMDYSVMGFPTLVLIDPSGVIYTRHIGVWSRPEIEDVLEQIRTETPSAG